MYTSRENPREGFNRLNKTEIDSRAEEKSFLESPDLKELAEAIQDVQYSDQEEVIVEDFDVMDYFNDKNRNLNDIRRKGRELKLNSQERPTKEEYEKAEATPEMSYEAALGNADEEKAYRGYGWWGRDNTIRVVLPNSIKEGYELYSLSKKGENDVLDFEPISVQPCEKPESEIDVEVPSRTEKSKKYKFGFRHLPLDQGEEKFSTWPNTDVKNNESCKDGYYQDICKPYKFYQKFFDAHNVAGFAECYSSKDSIALNIFPPPKEGFVEDMDVFKDWFIIQDSQRKRPPRKTEINVLGTAISIKEGFNYAFCEEPDAFERENYVKI